MIFLANRANLDKRTVLTRLRNTLQTQVSEADSPIDQVWYHTSAGNKVGIHATIHPDVFLGESYPVATGELQITFDFPLDHEYDFYTIQWVESERELMVGWHQDATHMDLGKCHFQIDYRENTVQRETAAFLDAHPLNVFDQRIDDLGTILRSLSWTEGIPQVPEQVIRTE